MCQGVPEESASSSASNCDEELEQLRAQSLAVPAGTDDEGDGCLIHAVYFIQATDAHDFE